MGVVATHLAQDAATIIIGTVFAYKALVTSRELDESDVQAEVFVQEQVLFSGHLQHLVEEFNHCIAMGQAFALLCQDRGHANGIIDGRVSERAEQHVELGLLHELTLGANAVEDLQEHVA